MLARDSECRLEATTQARYARCGDDWERKEHVTASVQRRVASEFGFAGKSARVGVDLMQSALSIYPGEVEVVESAFYLKHNICVPCPLVLGATVPDVMLSEVMSGPTFTPLTLHSLCAAAELTVLCCGSST